MADFGTTFERLELKYLIDEQIAAEIFRYIRPYCHADPFNPKDGGGYEISSLYLDTPSMAFHQAKLSDEPDRFKLRARTYGPRGPVFLEIKRKIIDVIHKLRVGVDREQSEDASRGFGTPRKNTASQRAMLDRFAYLASMTGAEPKILVRYEREAYLSSVDRYARVTFDRRLTAQRVNCWILQDDPDGRLTLDGAWQMDGLQSPVILELKCETTMPLWMIELIQSFQLHYQGFSKYSFGVEATARRAQGVPMQDPGLGGRTHA